MAVLLLAAGLGCRGFSAPTPETLSRVRALPPVEGPFLRVRAELDIASPWLSGRFEGVVVARTGPTPEVRAQFFPDLGGKAFDLVARPDHIQGTLPPVNQTTDAPLPLRQRPHPLHFIGLTLLEKFAPVTEDRIEGAREDGWILLRPVVENSRVTILLGPDGRIARRRFEWVHSISWEEVVEAGGSLIRAPDLRLRVTLREPERRDRVPEGTFRLPD